LIFDLDPPLLKKIVPSPVISSKDIFKTAQFAALFLSVKLCVLNLELKIMLLLTQN